MVPLLVLAVFLVGINADCITQGIPHTETGGALYKALLNDLAVLEIETATVTKQVLSTGCSFQTLDFFTQLIVTITGDNTWLERLTNGTINPRGSECIGENLRIDFGLKNIAAKAGTVISGPSCDQLTGAAKSQYLLQRYGMTLNALAAAPNAGAAGTPNAAPANAPAPGKWQKYVQDLNQGLANVRIIINSNDEANCVATTRTLSNGLKGILESAGLTTIVV